MYRLANVETERQDLAEPVLRLIYDDVTAGNVSLAQAAANVQDYINAHLDEAMQKPEEYVITDWEVLRDVVLAATREQLERSTTAGVEANWSMLEEWLASDEELA